MAPSAPSFSLRRIRNKAEGAANPTTALASSTSAWSLVSSPSYSENNTGASGGFRPLVRIDQSHANSGASAGSDGVSDHTVSQPVQPVSGAASASASTSALSVGTAGTAPGQATPSRSIATATLFGGAPLAITTSPLSDPEPDFGSSYEGPQPVHLGLAGSGTYHQPPSSVSPPSVSFPAALPSIEQQILGAEKGEHGEIQQDRRPPQQQQQQRQEGEQRQGLASMKPYTSPVVGEGAWMGASAGGGAGLTDASRGTPGGQFGSPSPDAGDTARASALSSGLSPQMLRYGASPGGQSDLSNEAHIHGISSDFSHGHHHHLQQFSTPPFHTPSSQPPSHLQHRTRTSSVDFDPSQQAFHAGGEADNGLQPSPFRMSAAETSDGRPSIQSLRSSTDPHGSGAGTANTPSAYHDSVSAFGAETSAATGRSGSFGPNAATSTPSGTQTGSTSLADISFHNASAASPSVAANNGMIHAPATLTGSNGLGPAMDEVVPTSFDEGMLRALCDMDCGMPLLFDRIKQSMVSAREAATFLKKRAAIEEEYARNLSKLARGTLETYSMSDAKAGSYVGSWQSIMKTHDAVADNRVRFASKLSEMSEELNNLAREVDKSRKQTKETGVRLEKNLTDAEAGVEKARARFDTAAEDLERLLLLKTGESAKTGELAPGGKRTLGKAIGKGGLLFKNKNPQQILRQEEEIRARTSSASDAFRKEVLSTQGIRQEYFNLQLPRILRSLKESAEEIDNGTQYHLARYAFLFESTLLNDGMTISPVGTEAAPGAGLRAAIESIDNRNDFKSYMQNYQVVHGSTYRGPRREGPYEEGFLPSVTSPAAPASTSKLGLAASRSHLSSTPARPIFGVDLADQMARDGVEVPPILIQCAEAIELHGLTNIGIYRLSGTTSKVQRLKARFNDDWTAFTLLDDAEAMGDINIVAGCLKLWFRELPEPLLTHELYAGFIDAAKVENDRLRHIRLHERVNELPDANYATLKYLMAHLDRIKSEDHHNQMSASNLAIVFGPTLLSPPPAGEGTSDPATPGGTTGGGALHLQDMSFQCRAVETILEKYREIFVDESEE